MCFVCFVWWWFNHSTNQSSINQVNQSTLLLKWFDERFCWESDLRPFFFFFSTVSNTIRVDGQLLLISAVTSQTPKKKKYVSCFTANTQQHTHQNRVLKMYNWSIALMGCRFHRQKAAAPIIRASIFFLKKKKKALFLVLRNKLVDSRKELHRVWRLTLNLLQRLLTSSHARPEFQIPFHQIDNFGV